MLLMAVMSQASSDNNDVDEFFYEVSSSLFIPEDVMRAIDQVVSSNDPIDDPDFNSLNYINSIFPTEQSICSIDEVTAQLQCKIRNLDDRIRSVVRMQTRVGKNGRDALQGVQELIRKLYLQTLEIKCIAEDSEESVKEITKDIKQLDCAKRNLTSAITTLNHLHMVVARVQTLRDLTGKRKYGEVVMPLQGLLGAMKHFINYVDIPQIKKFADEVNEIQASLVHQIKEDFQEALTGSNARSVAPTTTLADACSVVDILDPKVKRILLEWFVGEQLNEYLLIFNDCEENGWLDKIDHRYTWFKKRLLQCEDKFGAVFPPHWGVSERITMKFCQITKSELSEIMSKRVKEIDAKLLLYAIQRTSNLEQLLAVRFTGNTRCEESDVVQLKKVDDQKIPKYNRAVSSNLLTNPVVDNNVEESESNLTVSDHIPSPFHNMIGECFLPYLYIYIESLDRNLYELLGKFVLEFKCNVNTDQTVIGALPGVLPSCADLFLLFKKFSVQCNQMSNGLPMLSLCKLFEKYLREYAIKILKNNLPKFGDNSSSSSFSASVTNITRDLRDISSASSLIHNFLKEGEISRFSKVEIGRVCCILTTAEYCVGTTRQLEEQLKEKVEPSLVDKINLSREQDLFHSVISNCIQLLVQDLEIVCESELSALNRIQWQALESVGDESAYVTALTYHLKTSVSLIQKSLSFTRKYFAQFCIRFSHSFIPKFIQSLYKCKPLSTVGAEQLLLDTHILKTVLLDLPSIGCSITRKAPASYAKVVIKGMTRGENILKVVMIPIEPGISFVDQFLNLLPESDIQEFQKVLEMKGLRAGEKSHLLSIFRPRHSSRFVSRSSLTSSPKHDTQSIEKLTNIKTNFAAGKSE